MPVPKPHKNEAKEEFINRCMSDPNMQEYEQEQRLGVCFTQWDNRDKDFTTMATSKTPVPTASESRNDFMSRCLKDPSMEGMSETERFSACAIAWTDANKTFKADTPDWRCDADRTLPVKDGVAWDGSAAANRMLEAAGIGGDNPDLEKARRGFLACDYGNPNLKGSYKLPFADIVGGTLTAIGNGVRNAASRLPQTDGLSPDVQEKAKSVLDAYMSKLNPDSAKSSPVPSKRAHSVITIKEYNENDPNNYIIEGVATTPATDRYNDIVEPLGAEFSLPMPLLWQHDPTQPVGLVEVANATSAGINFRAKLPKIAEAGVLRDRINEAFQSVKAGLVRGVSIGFRPLTYEQIKSAEGDPTGGLRYNKWDWLELSLVTIPANAEATISTIKSIDNQNPRVRRNMSVVSLRAPGGTGKLGVRAVPNSKSTTTKPVSKETDVSKPISEQINEYIAVRGEKSARMTAIMDESADKGLTLDDAQQEEFDTLQSEIETIDGHLKRLRMLEKLQASTAKPVDGNNANGGTTSRTVGTFNPDGGHHPVTARKREPGIEFTRYAMCLMTARGNPSAALQIAEARYPDEHRVHNVLKAAVAAGTTTDPAWAGALVQYVDFAGDFIDFLRPATIIGKFGQNGIPALRQIPFNVRIKKQTSGGDAFWVGEGQPKPLTTFDFDVVLLRWAKIANIAVLTNEQVRFSTPNAEVEVRQALADAIAQRQDITFIDPTVTAIADTRPASITNGATSYAASGTDATAARADAAKLMMGLANNNLAYSNAVWIMDSNAAINLMLMRNALGQQEFPGLLADGGTFLGRPVIVSNNIVQTGSPSVGIIVLMVPQEIYLSDDGQVVVDASTEASLQMDSAPTQASTSGSPATPTATSVVSMFQTNSIAIRAERYINWARRRDPSVQYLTGVAYVA